MTDPHLFADPGEDLRGTVTHATLKRVLDHYRAGDWVADLVALTGDLVQDDSAGAYRRCRELFGELQLPILCVPGNHDVRALMQEALSERPFQYCGTREYGRWLIVGIDSCVHGEAGGRVSAPELARMEAAIEQSAAEHVLICLHHPPLPVGSEWLDRVGLENGDELLQRVAASGRVRAMIFGHIHQVFEAQRDSVAIFGTPSTCRQFMVGSDAFAVDDNPPAYGRITLHPGGAVEREVVQVAE